MHSRSRCARRCTASIRSPARRRARLWIEMGAGRIRAGGRAIPAWLDRAVRRGLEVAPSARWPSVASFVDAIERPPRRVWPYIVGAASVAVASMIVAIVALISARTPAQKPAPGDMSAEIKLLLSKSALAAANLDHTRALGIAEIGLAIDPTNAWATQLVALESCSLGNRELGISLRPQVLPEMQQFVDQRCAKSDVAALPPSSALRPPSPPSPRRPRRPPRCRRNLAAKNTRTRRTRSRRS